jgi:hypothetical protein
MTKHRFTLLFFTVHLRGSFRTQTVCRIFNFFFKNLQFLNSFCVTYFEENKQKKSWTVLRGPSRHKKSREQFGFFFSEAKIQFYQFFFCRKKWCVIEKVIKKEFLDFFFNIFYFRIPMGVSAYCTFKKDVFFFNKHSTYAVRKLKRSFVKKNHL